jgi:hypothetical protein
MGLTAAKILFAQTAKGQDVLTDNDKALVERLRWSASGKVGAEQARLERNAADRIEALSAEVERLREALKEVFEAWAGSEGFIPETAPEGYLLYLTKRMAHIARAALGEQQ